MNIALGIFMVLHGLVHLLYFGQSGRYFELQEGMVWPDGSWVFSRLLSDESTRALAGIACVIAAIGFVAGGIGLFAEQEWWRPVIITVAVFSIIFYVLFWDGTMQHMDDQGWVGILINATILVAVLVIKWPEFDF